MAKEIDKLRTIIGLDTSLQNIQDLDILLERILLEARQFTHADSGTIYLTRGDELVFAYTQNETKQKELPPGQKLAYSFFTMPINRDSISGYVASTKKILNIPDVYDLASDVPYHFNAGYDRRGNYKTTSMLTIPLVTSVREVVGVIQVINAMNAEGVVVPFDTDDELLVGHFANVASQALQRAQLTPPSCAIPRRPASTSTAWPPSRSSSTSGGRSARAWSGGASTATAICCAWQPCSTTSARWRSLT
jgi:GAF domain-containing protein